jgi:uncharacterized protein
MTMAWMPILAADADRAIAVVAAIQNGDVPGLQQQLSDAPELGRARIVDRQGVHRTLLHVVTDWPGHFPNAAQTVAVLVAAGADINAPLQHSKSDGSAETALHWAASSDDIAALDGLLDAGADIEAPGAVFTAGTPLSDAVVFAQWRAARRLLERGAKTTLWQAAALGLLFEVRQQISNDPPPRDQVTNAFWHACRGGQLDVAKYLFEQGADAYWIGYDMKTPLTVARESGAAALIEWLEAQVGNAARRS